MTRAQLKAFLDEISEARVQLDHTEAVTRMAIEALMTIAANPDRAIEIAEKTLTAIEAVLLPDGES